MSTKIEWTKTENEDGSETKGETWNPIAGCDKISAGCANCYAIKDAHRLAGNPNPKIAAKYEGTTKIENGKMNWTGRINFASDDVLLQPMRWTRPRKIFVNSMSDLFHESVPDEQIDKIFAVMAMSPHHTFQILTKRPERMRNYLSDEFLRVRIWLASNELSDPYKDNAVLKKLRKTNGKGLFPLPNVHLGVSVENQKAADERIPLLLETPAAVRWLSCEPLLKEIKISRWLKIAWQCSGCRGYFSGGWKMTCPDCERKEYWCGSHQFNGRNVKSHPNFPAQEGIGIDWVVVGGESGANARPIHPDWVRSLRDQCVSAGTPFFFKQWGSWFPMCEKPVEGTEWSIGKAEALSHIHLWDDAGGNVSLNIGKKNAGRFLDGRTWDEFPKEKLNV